MLFKITVFLLALLAPLVRSQDVGFSLDGAIQGATATDSTFNSGGTISVNGWSVIVPKNLQVGFTAAWVPWKDFVQSYSNGLFPNFEVSVVGNTLPDGRNVAGQISISQFFTQASQGFVSQVNNDGTINIRNGPTIRINDPNAVYSAGYTESPYMTADDQNPSITSYSGFPMCIPRSSSDPLCPQSNRPVIANGAKQGTLTAPDPLVMAPFVPGDFLEYSGYMNSRGEIVCYAIVATNIQIVTGQPFSYIRMEDVNIGVYSGDPNAEVADTKFIGYVSDPAGSPVTVSAIEVDPCTGKTSLRTIATANIRAGETRNKFETRLKSQVNDKYVREYMIKTATSTKVTKNGITVGQYVQPVTEWIQPELTAPGVRPLPNDFSGFLTLTRGLGLDLDGNHWGPLSPFPQSGVTVFDIASCPPPVTPTTLSTAVSSTSTAAASPTVIPPDTVRVTSAAWTSSGGGTLSVTCTSSNTNSTQVGMVLDYRTLKDDIMFFNLAMTPSANIAGTWTFSNVKIKQATTVWCRSKLGSNATLAVTAR